MDVTLKWQGGSGDGKRAFVEAQQNDGWRDLRIELDTDDCDSDHAIAMMQEVIKRVNGYGAQAERIAKLESALVSIRDSAGVPVMVCDAEGHSFCVHTANAALA